MECIEQVFPYGHTDRRPAAPVDVLDERPDPATMTLDQLTAELDGLDAARNRLDARRLAVLGAWDRRGGPVQQGATSAAAALQYRHGRDGRDERRATTIARKLRHLPEMAAALAAGETTVGHAETLGRARTTRTADAMQRDESRLVELARRLCVEDYRKALRHWKAHADPDGTDPDTGMRNELYLSQTIDGEWFGKIHLDPEAGAIVKRALDAAIDDMHRGGDDDSSAATPAPQRRGEAFVELMRRGGAVTETGEPHHRTRPSIVATIDHENLVRQLGLGQVVGSETVLGAAAMRRLACDADIIAAVYGTDDELLELGRRARLVSPAQRLALALRDGGCAFPGCDRPPDWCDAHHVRHWVDLGPTDLDNLCLLCSAHHHLVHEGGWTIRRGADGQFVFHRPGGDALPSPPRRRGHPDPFLDPIAQNDPVGDDPPGHDPPEAEPEPPARGAPTEDDDDQWPAA